MVLSLQNRRTSFLPFLEGGASGQSDRSMFYSREEGRDRWGGVTGGEAES